MARDAAHPVTLYTRHDCHLCEDAAAMLQRLAGPLGLRVVTCDVDADPALQGRYGDRVPVVAIDGEEIAAGLLHEPALEVAIRERLGGRDRSSA